MKRALFLSVVAAGILAGGAVAVAQQPPSLTGGFSVEGLVFELSLFMPAGQGAAPRITRDPALFLTGEQIDKILPIMRDLKASPFPTPSRAKTIRAGVDAVLSKAQKGSWEKAQKDLAKARADAQASAGSQPGGQAGGFRNFSSMTPEQQKELLQRLPEDQRKAFQDRMKAVEADGKLSPEQRRVRLIDRFIGQLEERRAELGKA
jgi:hypothetical protein